MPPVTGSSGEDSYDDSHLYEGGVPYEACYHCQENHNPHEHELDGAFNPDWNAILARTPSVHRTIGIALPGREHALVHDPATRPEDAARAIMHHLSTAYPYMGHAHWSAPQGMEHTRESYGSSALQPEGENRPVTSVTLHAKTPAAEHVEKDPSTLIEAEITPHQSPEYEIPLTPGAPVHLTGVSWAHARTGRWEGGHWNDGPEQQWRHHEFREPMRMEAAARRIPVTAVSGTGTLRNPYHGTEEFGGRPEWSHTWFHGTKGEPAFGERRKNGYADERAKVPLEQRDMRGHGWTQPNQWLGVHFSPLHEVAHKFADGGIASTTSSIVHARLKFSDPAVYRDEDHLNIAMADWASKHYPHWHDEKLNDSMGWNYGDQEGTHRDFSRVPEDQQKRYRLGHAAQRLLQFHLHMPEILNGFRQGLKDQGHHGIVYGNGLEGPYITDATRGGEASLRYEKANKDMWGKPRSFSAIAHPDDIETTHVERIAPWREEPKDGERTWEDVSDQDESDDMRDRVLGYHREHGGKLPFRLGAAWQPSSGIFAPTTGLDPRLFDERHRMRPAVREAVMERLDRCLRTDSGVAGSDWQKWLKVYIAGGSASEWAGTRPNDAAQDLDVLIGVDYESARKHSSALSAMDDRQIDTALNAAFRGAFNLNGWQAAGGTWDVTAYANPDAWDIRAIKPYAAWDLSDSRWAVRPPHLPDHSLADFDPAVLAQARAVAAEARAILRLPEPLRTREATALWERIHAGRSTAFSSAGSGWEDPGNVDEKWLAYAPHDLLGHIRELALSKTAVLAGEPGSEHDLDEDASKLGVLYHSTPYATGFPYDEWMHVGDHRAASERAALARPEEYGLPKDAPVHIHSLRLHGRVYPRILDDDLATGMTGDAYPIDDIGDGYPSGRGCKVFPYKNTGENRGHLSFLVHRSAIEHLGTETHQRSEFQLDPAYHPRHGQRLLPVVPKTAAADPYEIRFDEDYHGRHRVSAWPPGAPEWTPGRGYANSLGEMHWHPEEGTITHLQVNDSGRGIGTALWNRAGREAESRGLVPPKHSPSRTPAADAWAHSVGGYIPELQEGCKDPRWIASLPADCQVRSRTAAAGPRTRDEQLAALDANTRASALAQEDTRLFHPYTTMRLDEKNGQNNAVMTRWLADAGVPKAGESYVAMHQYPGRMQSNSGRGPDGEPCVILHPDRWDYGTMAHETAHIITDHQTGRRLGEPHGPEGAHGDQWAHNYAGLLNRISKDAGDYFLAGRRENLGGLSAEAAASPYTYEHDEYGNGQHWFSAQHPEAGEVGHALVYEKDGPGGPHVEIEKLETDREHRNRGVGSQLLENVGRHFPGQELRLKPYPLDEDGDQTSGDLEEYYEGRGFEHRPLREGEPWDLHGWMHKQAGSVRREAAMGDDRDWGEGTTIRMAGPEEYGKYVYPDYKARTPQALAAHFRKTYPDYFGKLKDDIAANGMHSPILVRYTQPNGRPLKRPRVMDGHNRAAAAYELGARIPVGDYDNQADYDASSDQPGRRKWWSENWELKEQGQPPWRRHSDPQAGETSSEKAGSLELGAEAATKVGVKGYADLTPRSAMIYLDLPEGTVQHVPGGVDDSHITVVYLGKDVGDEEFAEACRRTRAAAAQCPPLNGFMRGVETFEPGDGGKTPAFVPVFVPGIGKLRALLKDLNASQYRQYRPHVTLAYLEPGDDLPAPHPRVPVSFDRLHVKRGDHVVSFPLGRPRE